MFFFLLYVVTQNTCDTW